MHLRLNEDEYATLIDMVSLAAEVSSYCHGNGTEDQFMGFENLEDKILEKAKDYGFGDIIEIDPERDKHRVTSEYQESSYIQECLDEMRNEVFWEELALRLAERDILRTMGEAQYQDLNDVERIKLLTPLQGRYWERFAKTGLEEIHLIAPHGTG